MKKRKHEKNFIRNRSGGMKQKLPGRLLSLMCALVLVLSTVFLDLGHISAYAFGDELYLETEAEETAEAGAEAQAADLGDDESQINTELSEDISEDPAEVSAEEAEDASEADFSSGDNLDEQELTTEEPEISDDSAAETITYTQLINNDTVEVRAEAPAGALPEGTELVVKEIKNNTDDAEMTEQYNRLSARITEQLQNQGKNLDGFLPYNISFTDMDGNPVKPSEKVTYSFRYTEAAAPELTDPSASTVTAAQLKENKETAQLDLTELKAEENKLSLETNESRQLHKAAFQAADNAVYTFIWSSTPAADNNGEANNEETQEPESEPTQIGTIRLLVDEVNLRTAPSIEADVIGTADAGTELPLLEIVTAEDGSTWYKVSYSDTVVYVSGEVAEVVEAEEAPTEEAPAEITRYDYQSDEVNVKVTLTNPADLPDNAELSVTPVELSQEAEEQIAEEAIKEKKAIENIRSYDIKFLVDGEEVQPGATVKVEVSFPDEETAQDAAVYHVDQDEKVENMDGSINKEGNVEFETTHFSTYVIVNKGSSKVKVTLQHYYGETKIYADTVRNVTVGNSIQDYRATENYSVEKVAIVKDGEETPVKDKDIHEIKVYSDTTVKIYYKPKTSTEKGDVVFYDYQISPTDGTKGINADSHYSGTDTDNRMIMGTRQVTGLDYNAYGTNTDNSGHTLNANDCNYKNNVIGGKGTLGLVSGLSTDYSTVLWNVDQPGFFTDDNPGEGKEKLTDYKLLLEKTGNNYKLTGVQQPGGTTFTVNSDGSDFFPISNPKADQKNGGRFYFGMRYDIEFKLGDYVGPLDYSFTGDDDLWVLLDGKVVIDVGGIHDAISESTDLWEDLGFHGGARPAADDEDTKNKTHRITVLYMERGAGKSNCQMNFTIPDAKFVNVTNIPFANITINKTNSTGAPLAGAKFRLVNDTDSSDTYSVLTTDSKGQVTFENLKEGDYTLTEAMAPDNYVSIKENYKIKVTAKGETATAKLYKADGTTEVEGNKIINYTETEEAEKNLTSSKTAKVVDYQNRIYQIDLNAATTGREAGVEAKGASVVLVLDASNSMNERSNGVTKISALKTAAKSFIDSLSSRSKESEISVIWYHGSEEGEYSVDSLTSVTDFTQLSDKGANSLKKGISEYSGINGGTPMGAALQKARTQLGKAHRDNKKYIVFMTDGLPGYWSGDYSEYYGYDSKNCQVANNAVNNASAIKDEKDGNAVIYTVGVGLNGSFNWTKGHSATSSSNHGKHSSMTGEKFLSDYIATSASDGKKYAYTTNNLSELTGIFEDIAGRIGDLFTVQPEQIVDVIDARFKLTKESEDKLKALNNSDKTGHVDIRENADGTTTITWTGNAAKIGNAEAEKEEDRGWSSSFQIQARDDFIGGNMIPTNGASSGIYLEGGGSKKFEQPSVNVRLLSLKIDNKEITVFKGDPIKAQDFRNELAKTIKVVELDGKTTTLEAVTPQENGVVKLPELTDLNEEQKNKLKTEKKLTIGEDQAYKYDYKETEAVGYFTYTYELVKGEEAGEHTANEVGTPAEQYRLTVEYHPYSTETRNTLLTETGVTKPNTDLYTSKDAPKADLVKKPKGGEEVTEGLTATGTYTVNVIAGEMQIVKKLDVASERDETFTFEIKDSKDNVIATATVNVKKGETEVIAKFELKEGVNAKLDSNKEKLTELARGGYTVTEVRSDDAHYELDDIVARDTTNCLSVITKDQQQKATQITFTMGTAKDNIQVLKGENKDTTNGRIGVAEFTNKKSVVNIDFEKVDKVDAGSKLSGAEFALYEADENNEKTGDPIKNVTSGNNGAFTLDNLPVGKYVLVETKAPTGYQLSEKTWLITVNSDRTTTVTYNGNDITPAGSEEAVIYQITNTKLYSLPSSGGPGIYGFTISGVAFITAALLLFINNKRKEDEAKFRSTH